MRLFDFDPEKLKQESEDANNSKMWLNVANSAANNVLSAPSASEIMLGQKRAPVNVGLDKVASGIEDPWEKQKKTYEAYKASKDGQALEADTDENSREANAMRALLVSKYKADPEQVSGMNKRQMSELFGNTGKMAEIQQQAEVNFKNEMAKQKASQGFTAGENEKNRQAEMNKEMLKRSLEQAKKNDPGDKMKAMSGADKARFDNALMVSKALDEMGSALDKGDNTFSLFGDNNYTEAQRKAAEAYGRMQSGGAINKDEEERFLAMLPGVKDSKEMQRKKILSQRDEMMSRLKTLGFTPEEAGYSPKSFAYGAGKGDQSANSANAGGMAPVKKEYNPKLNKTRITMSDGSVQMVDGRQ
jgi:hypothetical protein